MQPRRSVGLLQAQPVCRQKGCQRTGKKNKQLHEKQLRVWPDVLIVLIRADLRFQLQIVP